MKKVKKIIANIIGSALIAIPVTMLAKKPLGMSEMTLSPTQALVLIGIAILGVVVLLKKS